MKPGGNEKKKKTKAHKKTKQKKIYIQYTER